MEVVDEEEAVSCGTFNLVSTLVFNPMWYKMQIYVVHVKIHSIKGWYVSYHAVSNAVTSYSLLLSNTISHTEWQSWPLLSCSHCYTVTKTWLSDPRQIWTFQALLSSHSLSLSDSVPDATSNSCWHTSAWLSGHHNIFGSIRVVAWGHHWQI